MYMGGGGGVNVQFTPVCYVETARPIISPTLPYMGIHPVNLREFA